MPIVFTICSNNYLWKAIVLGHSVDKYYPNKKLLTILVDHLSPMVDYTNLPFETIPIEEVEPQINELANRYNINELNACVKPQVFKFLFEKYPNEQIVYLDPDIELFHPLKDLDDIFTTANSLAVAPNFDPTYLPWHNQFSYFSFYHLLIIKNIKMILNYDMCLR